MVAKFFLIALWVLCLPIALIIMAIPIGLALIINLIIICTGLFFVILGAGSLVGFFIGLAVAEIIWGYLDNEFMSLALEFATPCWEFWRDTYNSILY
jgi:hypothetical protein